ncbi:MAG: HAD-IC family P-type ATPase [Lachnospiraceae bacterium]|nr:HAD-IC family P-type ATPase [Lachnospiraceae bacterium]MDD7435823.1 HAD-IC family P-type ATPase [Lachnospiraceae bacterium]
MEEKQFHGLSSAEVEDRIRMDRTNHMNTSASKSVSDIVKEHSLTYFNFLNLFLAVLVALTGQFKNMTFMGVILINTAIGIVQELKVKKLIDQISVMTAARTRVIREGVTKEIDVSDVVIDDVILVESGEQVCADCRLLDATGIEVNESMLTGESRPVKKQAGEELMSGSYLVSGSGVAKVFHVGENNYAATLAKKAKIKKRASSQMQEIIKKIIKIDGVLLIPVGILLYLSQRGIAETTSDAVVNTVAGVIGMIPEGLVLLTSVSFVLGVGRLARKKALVQEMEAIEALARVNVLCLDKTGTITTGKLDVVDVVPVQEEQSPEEITTIMGELTWAFDDVNSTQDALRKKFKKIGKWKAEEKIPFSSDRKYRAAFFEEHGGYALGAPEFLVPENTQLMERVNQYSAEGMRVLLLASATLKAEEMKLEEVKPLGLIIIEDQIRPEAKDTFAYFREQKVAIKVLSGDNPVTVSQIAGKAGLEGADKYLDARNLPEDFEELREVVEKYAVFGRVRPEQKQNIIKACQANGKVAGMVGDGVNDVLALKDADCGIAMAAGSDAAKQVAHIVLLDSNFASMTNIVGEGRTIISNIEKVSSLYLTKTIYSVLLCLIFIFWQKEYPFIPIQLSWISGVAIGVPSFLLTLEQNQNSISEGFLRHVMRVALPAALTMVGTLVLTEVLSPFWNGEDLLSSLYHLVLGGMVSLIVVYRVCMPMTRYHKVLCVGLTVIFAAGLVIAPGFLGIHRLDCWQSVFLIPMICMVCVLNQGLTHIFEWMDGKLKKVEK